MRASELEDVDRSREIELVGTMVAAAADLDRHLTSDEIDAALGVTDEHATAADETDQAQS